MFIAFNTNVYPGRKLIELLKYHEIWTSKEIDLHEKRQKIDVIKYFFFFKCETVCSTVL